ncbi:MAG: RIO1 family regulatory kinase/ATPase [Sulfolobales archaeon]
MSIKLITPLMRNGISEMHLKLARTCKDISKVGLSILSILDEYLDVFEYVPEELVFKKVRIPEKTFAREISTLRTKKLVESHSTRAAYRLTFLGLDCLALLELVEKGVVTHVGPSIGTGKESVLYLAKTSTNEIAVVKFYKIGRVSFKKVVRYRGYLTDQPSWLEASKLAAEREYRALLLLSKHTNLIPKVWGWSKHAVVMEYIDGEDLYRYRNARDPKSILNLILTTMRSAYLNAGIVHADLSEYNIVVSVRDSSEIPYIIDWPQYVSREDPLAEEYLTRDVSNLLKFFKRRYGVSLDLEKAVGYVKGLVDGI